jgi:hypothetical protein
MNVCILNDKLEHINLRKMRRNPNYAKVVDGFPVWASKPSALVW